MFGLRREEPEEHAEAASPVDGDGVDEHGLFPVWPENWKAVQFFLRCGRCWTIVSVGMAGMFYEGLDATKVLATMDMMGINQQQRPALLDDLRLMEAEARSVLNRKLKEGRK